MIEVYADESCYCRRCIGRYVDQVEKIASEQIGMISFLVFVIDHNEVEYVVLDEIIHVEKADIIVLVTLLLFNLELYWFIIMIKVYVDESWW